MDDKALEILLREAYLRLYGLPVPEAGEIIRYMELEIRGRRMAVNDFTAKSDPST